MVSKSSTLAITLDQFIGRLRQRAEVEGLIVMGSAARGAPGPHSDYDLLVVLKTLPAPLSVGLTRVDGRLTDLIFITAEEVERLVSRGPQDVPADGMTGRLIGWLKEGRIRFDRTGKLAATQATMLSEGWTRGPSWAEQYRTWFSLNYDLAQTRRYATNPDPAAQSVVDLRLLSALNNIWFAYFQLRGLPQVGKEAARYLADTDAAFLTLFQRCAGEPARWQRFEMYAQLVERAAAPWGPVWAEDATTLQWRDDAAVGPASVQAALAWWGEMIAAPLLERTATGSGTK